MSLYRLIYAEACSICNLAQACVCAHSLHQHHLRRKGPTRHTIAHGAEGECALRAGEQKCRCPKVDGEVLQFWVKARNMEAAWAIGKKYYPSVDPMRIEKGLDERTLGARKARVVGSGY